MSGRGPLRPAGGYKGPLIFFRDGRGDRRGGLIGLVVYIADKEEDDKADHEKGDDAHDAVPRAAGEKGE